MMRMKLMGIAGIGCSVMAGAASAGMTDIVVTIENLSPSNGTFLTPVWVGFHNGEFDIYDNGRVASVALERLAEDGNTSLLSADFAASGDGALDGTIGGMPIAPGASVSMNFSLDGSNALSRYFSYGSMVVPSNDAFIANGNQTAHPIFDTDGNFIGADFIIMGSMVRDAGTEQNTEIPEHTALFGQMSPNTGLDENGLIHNHPGFLPPGSGGILDDPMFANADFTQDGYQLARITVTQIPAPGALALLGLAGLMARRRR